MMAHPMHDDVRRTFGDKIAKLSGDRGEYPVDRAARIAGAKVSAAAQGDSGHAEEFWTGAPARQVSNYGNVRK